MSKGFSIIELLLITAITATFSVVLILSFGFPPSGQTARYQSTSVVASDVRRVQSMALAGSGFQGSTVCGFGIHYVDKTTYLIYAGVLDGAVTRCQDANHNYQAGIDLTVETKVLINPRMEMRSTFLDFFFESPDPKTYIDNDPSLIDSLGEIRSAKITIQLKNQQNCAQKTCVSVTIFASGEIDLKQ